VKFSVARYVDSQRFNLGVVWPFFCLHSRHNSKSAETETNLLRQSVAREQEQRRVLEAAERGYLKSQNNLDDAQRIEALGKIASGVAHNCNNSLPIIIESAETAQLDSSNTTQVDKSLASTIRVHQHCRAKPKPAQFRTRRPHQISECRSKTFHRSAERIIKQVVA
jgi:C4-dicarboxylate-specific signal transduction histidine kinase